MSNPDNLSLPQEAVPVRSIFDREGDEDAAKRWIKIGYAVKRILNIETVREVEDTLMEPEEA